MIDPANYDPATPLGWTPDSGDEPEEPADPNADLVGKTVTIGEREWSCGGSVTWSNNYVYLVAPAEDQEAHPGLIDMLCRPAGIVRRHLQLTEDDRA